MTDLTDAECRAVADLMIGTMRATYKSIISSGATAAVARSMLIKAAESEGALPMDLAHHILDIIEGK